ncbi:MAG TPA: NTPase [Anaerolineae bacterium]|nr:NTPase [Anaerolineae bacterium]
MSIKIMLTGPPGCGKTTAIRQVLDRLQCEAHGFTTQEIREGGRRTGFKLTTVDGQEGLLAHTRIRGRPRVGKYGVDLTVMDELAVASIRQGMRERSLIVIDEIGPMELLSGEFRSAVLEALETDLSLIGTIMMRSSTFTDSIKARQDVRLIRISRGTMRSAVEEIVETLGEPGLSRRI